MLYASVGLLAGACAPHSAPSVAAPESVDLLAVEIAAARHLVADDKGLRLMVHPAFSDSFSAPGRPGPVRREELRTAALAHALGAQVYSKPTDSREPVKGSAELVLSQPIGRSDTVRITGTFTWYNDDRPRVGRGYRTVQMTLARLGGEWRVIQSDLLGIT
jgi:hypothetical protein